MIRNAHPLRPLVWLGVAVGVLVLVGWCRFQVTVDARWQELRAWTKAQRAAWEARSFHRRPLWGEARPGSAWEAYREALAAASASAGDGEEAPPGPERNAALEALREGAHRTDVAPGISWDGRERSLDIRASPPLRAVVLGEFRAALAEGDGRRAVQVLLDGMTLAGDALRTPFRTDGMIASTWLEWSVGELSAGVLDALGHGARARLAEGLERLERGMRCSVIPSLEDEVLVLAHRVLGNGGDLRDLTGPGGPSSGSAWRYGFSDRLVRAMGVLELAEECRELRIRAPWPDRRPLLRRFEARAWHSGNPLVPALGCGASNLEEQRRRSIARVRMLRMELAWRAGGEVPGLHDPLGAGPLDFEVTKEAVTIRSAGRCRDGKPLQRRVVLR